MLAHFPRLATGWQLMAAASFTNKSSLKYEKNRECVLVFGAP
jgi:hypothetical protein